MLFVFVRIRDAAPRVVVFPPHNAILQWVPRHRARRRRQRHLHINAAWRISPHSCVDEQYCKMHDSTRRRATVRGDGRSATTRSVVATRRGKDPELRPRQRRCGNATERDVWRYGRHRPRNGSTQSTALRRLSASVSLYLPLFLSIHLFSTYLLPHLRCTCSLSSGSRRSTRQKAEDAKSSLSIPRTPRPSLCKIAESALARDLSLAALPLEKQRWRSSSAPRARPPLSS